MDLLKATNLVNGNDQHSTLTFKTDKGRSSIDIMLTREAMVES